MQKLQNIQQPKLGVALIILNGNKVLIGQRTTLPMINSWQFPGEWVFDDESEERAGLRHLESFRDMQCHPLEYVTFTNNRFEDGAHSLSLYYQTKCMNAERVNLALNDDCQNWCWAEWEGLPEKLFLPLELLKSSGFAPHGYKNHAM